jgi:hypothetical protein
MRFFHISMTSDIPVGRLLLVFGLLRRRMDLSLAHVARGSPRSLVNIFTGGLASAGTLRLSSRKGSAPRRHGSVDWNTVASARLSFDKFSTVPLLVTLFFAAPVTLMFTPFQLQPRTLHTRSTHAVPMHPQSRREVRLGSILSSRCRHKGRPLT